MIMRINVLVDENNKIVSWTSFPLDESKPILELDDPYSIRLGFDKFDNGKLVKNEKEYEKSKKRERKIIEILELKQKLSSTDYKLFKYLEGEITEEEYLQIKKERQEWRSQINKLEGEINEPNLT